MKRFNVILGVIVAIWISLLFIFIETRIKAALYILPVFTVCALVWLAFATISVIKAEKNKENKSPKPTEIPSTN